MYKRAIVTIGFLLLFNLAIGCGGTQNGAPASAPPADTAARPTIATASPAGPATPVSKIGAEATATRQPAISPTTRPAAQPTSRSTPTSPSTASSGLGQEYSFEQLVTVSGQQVQTMKVAIKGQKTRLEFVQGGESMVMIGNPEQKTAYMIFPSQKRAMKIPYEQFDTQREQARDPGLLSKEAVTGQLAGTDVVDGKPCDVYIYSGAYGSSKVWIWKDKGLPLKAEISGSGEKISIQYRDMQIGGLPDSLFELPLGTQVLDLGHLPVPGILPAIPTPGR